ncbi:hypothetical protein RJT34_29515 [Clitoria ternatea]|uniref:Exostosin GT47 domain-containing protein n=1 Tax=Clitoria ternatea TaxID=43366 RepID=A0AAN9FC54_CLITE
MGICVLAQRFCDVAIRRFLVVIGVFIAIILVFQCYWTIHYSLFGASDNISVAFSLQVPISQKGVFRSTASTNVMVDVTFAPHSEKDAYEKEVDLDGEVGRRSHEDANYSFTQKRPKYVYDDAIQKVREMDNKHNVKGNVQFASQGMIPSKGVGILDASGTQSVQMETQNEKPHLLNSHLKNESKMGTSIEQMNTLLLQSFNSSSMSPRWSSSRRDRELLSAKREIEKAHVLSNSSGLYVPIFRDASKFSRSYELMERKLKVYIYREGGKPIFHQPKMRGLYAAEGWFMKLMEGNKRFVVRDPRKAHLFYLPFSSQMLRVTLSGGKQMEQYLEKYVQLIAGRYHFWNRTGGADHFLVACHDWASQITRLHMKSCIRSLCNSNVAKGFQIGKDTTLPVTYIHSMMDPLRGFAGKLPSERSILAFFAGSMHGYLRPILIKHWENKEPDMKIFGPMPRDLEGKRMYMEYMNSSKYCICARGYEVHTPRIVEAIFSECVPVIIADNYVPPFFEVLKWEAFSVFVGERDIPSLRNILLSIPEEKYLALHLGVKKVQQHFLWHKVPVKYDLFHMILHSIWNNRLSQIRPK